MSAHGTVGRYTNEQCRCDECRTAIRAYLRNYRAARRAERVEVEGRMVAPGSHVAHGRAATYQNRGCRCEPCSAAWAADQRDYRAMKRDASERVARQPRPRGPDDPSRLAVPVPTVLRPGVRARLRDRP